jgi:hypothetical protein
VALALADKYQPSKKETDRIKDPFERWLETRKEAGDKIVKGIGWFASSMLILVALGLFSNTNDWIIIWMCLVGWMAVLGIISIVTGTAGLMESRFMRRQLGQASGASALPFQPLAAGDPMMINEAVTSPMSRPQSSVTEHTTTRLIKPEPPSNQTS